jgi:regulation of enolase protein 1 (concanavalin A-like superfamily)
MRERRLYDGRQLLFDARDILDARKHKGKVVVKMKNGPVSYTTDKGTKFWNKHPYQWVSEEERDFLLSLTQPEFVLSSKEDIEDYYAVY